MDANTIIQGGVVLTVTLDDGSQEQVTVRLLKIKQYADYMTFSQDEEKMADFLCSKPEGWSETLSAGSLLDIMDAGHDLNFQNACRWANRRMEFGEAMLPVAKAGEKLLGVLPKSAETVASS